MDSIIKSFLITGNVVWTGVTPFGGGSVSQSVDELVAIVGRGFYADKHFDRPRLWDGRENDITPENLQMQGIPIFHTRQWSAICTKDRGDFVEAMGNPQVDNGDLGENLVLEMDAGVENFSKIPPGSRLFFHDNKGGLRPTILWVTGENGPCYLPGQTIAAKNNNDKRLVKAFTDHAQNRRGIVGIVFGGGKIKPKDKVTICIPQQTLYLPPSP